MNFEKALEAIKDGKKAKRRSWNGKDQYIQIGTNVSYKTPDGEVVNANNEYIGNKVIVFYGSVGHQVGWLASQGDMLADDWEIFD